MFLKSESGVVWLVAGRPNRCGRSSTTLMRSLAHEGTAGRSDCPSTSIRVLAELKLFAHRSFHVQHHDAVIRWKPNKEVKEE